MKKRVIIVLFAVAWTGVLHPVVDQELKTQIDQKLANLSEESMQSVQDLVDRVSDSTDQVMYRRKFKEAQQKYYQDHETEYVQKVRALLDTVRDQNYEQAQQTLQQVDDIMKKISPNMRQTIKPLVDAQRLQLRQQAAIALREQRQDYFSRLARLLSNPNVIQARRLINDANAMQREIITAEKRKISSRYTINDVFTQYRRALALYSQAYQEAGIVVDPRDATNAVVMAVHNFYDLLLKDIEEQVKNVVALQREKKNTATSMDILIKKLDEYDALVTELVKDLFAKKDEGVQYYRDKRTALVLGVFTTELKEIADITTKFTPAVIKRAESYFAKATKYWLSTVTIVGFANAAEVKKSFYASMGLIYQATADYMINHLDVEKNTPEKINQLFDIAQRYDQRAAELYGAIDAQDSQAVVQEKIKKIRALQEDYKSALTARSQAQALERAVESAAKKQAAQLYKQASDVFRRVQAITLADQMLSKSNYLFAQAYAIEGQDLIQQYLTKSGSGNFVRASGIVPASEQEAALLAAAASAYKNALDALIALGFARNGEQDSQSVVPALLAAQTMLTSLLAAEKFRAQGDAQAKLTSEQGLIAAEKQYNLARQEYRKIDLIAVQNPNAVPFLALYPALISNDGTLTYERLFNRYVADLYAAIGQPLIASNPILAFYYFSAAASHGVDMKSYFDQLQGKLNFVDAAHTALEQARTLSRDKANWQAQQQDGQGYTSVASAAWHHALSLYESAIKSGAQVTAEYAEAVQEYAQQYKQNVPDQYFPLLGAAALYDQVVRFYQNQNDQARITQVQSKINALVQELKGLLQTWSAQVDSLRDQKKFEQAVELQQRIVTYYTAVLPGATQSLLAMAETDVQAARLKVIELYKQWADAAFDSGQYDVAFTNYARVRSGYQELGRTDVAQDRVLKQRYFLTETLATAQSLASNVVAQGEVAVADQVRVPQRYFLKSYQAPVPQGFPSRATPAEYAKYGYVAYRLAAQGIEYAAVYEPGTTNRQSSLSADQAATINTVEQEADTYLQKYPLPKEYEASVQVRGETTYLVERNKPIPALTGPYEGAPTAMNYYYPALLLYKPGRDLVAFGGKSFVPGQKSDAAWNMSKAIAELFLSDAVTYQKNMDDIFAGKDRSMNVFQKLRIMMDEWYMRVTTAQQFYDGKDQEENFQGISKFAEQASYLNFVIGQYRKKAGDNEVQFLAGAPNTNEYRTVIEEVHKNYALARQHYSAYFQKQGAADPYTITQANTLLVAIAQLYTKAGDDCMQPAKPFYFSAAPYYHTATYYYQDLVTHNATVAGADLAQLLNTVTLKTYESYFKAASYNMGQFRTYVGQTNLIGGLSFFQLVEKRIKASLAGSNIFLSNQEFALYNTIEALILDSLMYFLLAQEKYSQLGASDTDKTAKEEATKQVDALIKDFMTKSGITPDKTEDNKDFQALADRGFAEFMKIENAKIRYLALSSWAFKIYFSLAQTYMKIYLPGLPSETQWVELKSRTEARLREITTGIA